LEWHLARPGELRRSGHDEATTGRDLASTFAIGEESMQFGSRASTSSPSQREVIAPLNQVENVAVMRGDEHEA
jgi:hypothetical protein